MRKKPLIGLNADYRSAKKDSPAFSYLAAGYYDSISGRWRRAGHASPSGRGRRYEPCARTSRWRCARGREPIWTRGATASCCIPACDRWTARREEFDRLLMKLIAKRRLPVFGIGSGMQLINVSQGGNLYLHIPEDLPKAIPHSDSIDPAHRHGLEVVPGTLMERVFGDGEIRVNSMHHMAIDELAPGFMVSARSPDGVIEAIESKPRRLVGAGHAVPSGSRERLGTRCAHFRRMGRRHYRRSADHETGGLKYLATAMPVGFSSCCVSLRA